SWTGAACRRTAIRSGVHPRCRATGSARAATRAPWPSVWSRSSSQRTIEASMSAVCSPGARGFLLETALEPAFAVAGGEVADDEDGSDHAEGVDPVPLDRVGGRVAAVVR